MSRVSYLLVAMGVTWARVSSSRPPSGLSPALDFRDRLLHCLIHGPANLMVGLRHAFLVEVLAYRAEHTVAVRLVEIGDDDICGVSLGGCAGHSELLGGPQANQLVAARTSLEPKFLIMREFTLETFLALVEGAHMSPRCVANSKSALIVALHNDTRPSRQLL